MNVIRYTDSQAFCDRVLPLLLQREAENNLMIGTALLLADGTGRWGDEPPVLCAIEANDTLVAAALQTPPYHVQLTRMDQAAVTALVDYLRSNGVPVPGILGPEETVNSFAVNWAKLAGVEMQGEKGMGVYQLDAVIPPAYPGGLTAMATQEDKALLIEWVAEFNNLTGADRRDAGEIVEKALEQQHYWLWKDPQPVSLVAFVGPTPNGMRISSVYTPPQYRGRGYASANVAALSERLLQSGRKFCYLFTDLANPTSNGIYRKIGYRQVCDFASVGFAGKG